MVPVVLGSLDWEPEAFFRSKGGLRIKSLMAESKKMVGCKSFFFFLVKRKSFKDYGKCF